jgi:hypothetical protein
MTMVINIKEQLEKVDALIYALAREVIADPVAGTLSPTYVISVAALMNDVGGKEQVAEVMQALLKRPRAALVVFLSEAWVIEQRYKTDEARDAALQAIRDGGSMRPSQSPNRVESLIVSYQFKSGERALSSHRIERGPGIAPKLHRGEKIMTEEAQGALSGRFYGKREGLH